MGLSSAGHPARATANKRPSKGRSRLGSLQSERRGSSPALHIAGRPVTSAGRGDATLEKVAFLAFGITFRERRSEIGGQALDFP